MRQVPLERDVNIASNGPFWVEVANQEHPFTAMLISRSRGTYLIGETSRAKAFIRLMSHSIRTRTDMITLFAVYHVLNAARVKLPQL